MRSHGCILCTCGRRPGGEWMPSQTVSKPGHSGATRSVGEGAAPVPFMLSQRLLSEKHVSAL